MTEIRREIQSISIMAWRGRADYLCEAWGEGDISMNFGIGGGALKSAIPFGRAFD